MSKMADLALLNLSRNVIRTFPQELSSLTTLRSLDISHNHISDVSNMLSLSFQHLSILYNNKLQTLPDNITLVNLEKMNDLKLGANLWACDCKDLGTKRWMTAHAKVIKDAINTLCQTPQDMRGKNMIYSDIVDFCPNSHGVMYNIIIIVCASIVTFILICSTFLRCSSKKCWFIRRKPSRVYQDDALNDGKIYDIFVSYADEDSDYIENDLIQRLENEGFKICYHRVNFAAGWSIIDNISQSINNSKRTLAFFSTSYKKSRFCIWEYKEALNKDMQDGTHNLITIKDTDMGIEDLDDAVKSYLDRFTYIEKDAEKFWENLMFTLPKV